MDRLNCVGERVAKRRVALNLSQHELTRNAQVLGWDIDRKILSRIERGTRRVTDNEVYYLARLLECEMAELYPKRAEMDRTYMRANPARRKG